MEYGIVELIILALDIWALLSVWSSGSSGGAKLVWTIIILLLPVLGLLLWFLMGPKGNARLG